MLPAADIDTNCPLFWQNIKSCLSLNIVIFKDIWEKTEKKDAIVKTL